MLASLTAGAVGAGPSLEPILAEGIVTAPVDAVWRAWTTSDGLRSWLAPHADIELRVGGRMRSNYRPDGSLEDPTTIENTVLAFDPERMLAIKVAKTPAGFPFPTAVRDMWTVIYLEAAEPGRTRVRIVGLGFGPDEESQSLRAFFERGNWTTLEQLKGHFAAQAFQ